MWVCVVVYRWNGDSHESRAGSKERDRLPAGPCGSLHSSCPPISIQQTTPASSYQDGADLAFRWFPWLAWVCFSPTAVTFQKLTDPLMFLPSFVLHLLNSDVFVQCLFFFPTLFWIISTPVSLFCRPHGVYRTLAAPGHSGLFHMRSFSLISLAPSVRPTSVTHSVLPSPLLSLLCPPQLPQAFYFISKNLSLHLWKICSTLLQPCPSLSYSHNPGFLFCTSPRVQTLKWENKQRGLSIWLVAEGHLCSWAIKKLRLFWQLASFHLFPSFPSGFRQMHRCKKKKFKVWFFSFFLDFLVKLRTKA